MTGRSIFRRSRHALVAALLLAGMLAVVPASHADRGDHELARQALEEGRILPLRAVLDKVEREYPGQVMEIEFEREDGRFIYEIRLLQEHGQVVKMEVDATDGRVLKLKRKTSR